MQAKPIQHTDDGLILRVIVQTRASKYEIVGYHNDAIKIRITALPVDGKANKHLIAFLAKSFGISKQQVKLVSGDTQRDKCLHICPPTKTPTELNL